LKRILFIFAGLLFWLLAGLSQINVEMPGVINHYLQVMSVETDRVLITPSSELPYFHPGDKVLLIQMTGATMPTIPGFLTNPNKYKEEWRNAGMYEILQVGEVNGNYVVFTRDHVNIYDDGEKIQLVRLVEGDNVTVTANVTAKPWDGTTGGIIAVLGMDSVKLKANLDVSGLGFRGASVPTENYTGGCRKDVVPDEILDTLHFKNFILNKSGNKGEGIVTVDTVAWPYTKGAGCAINGGGGGNGLFSGGAGGGNYWQGGDGGRQSSTCPETLIRSWGGLACGLLYKNYGGIIMGGGGGSGVQNLLTSNSATNGGNGGGIIFIITGTLTAKSGTYLAASGQNVTIPATGSAGGGGGAGTVLLDATDYSGAITVKINGGQGGKGNAVSCTGSGGGGSGGVLWYSGNAITGATLAVDTSGGKTTRACLSHLGDDGHYGVKLNNMIINLTGFLFNTLKGIDTICAGQVPNKITGSRPKGGDGNYTWKWQKSIDSLNWVTLGSLYRDSLRLPALTQTTFYRRIVESIDKNSQIISDTSRALKIFVYPAITNNIISGTDTICYNLPAKTLTGTHPAGGNNIYQYQWQFRTETSVWSNGGKLDSLSPGPLQQSLYFRRQVTSAIYCAHTSNQVKITVLPSITNNDFFSKDSVICKDQGPGLLNALSPGQGDGFYTYLWQSRSTTGNWTSIPSSNVKRYDPGILTDSTIYRRIVYSGNGQACVDTLAIKSIHVLPRISNNIPSATDNKYCAGEVPLPLSGSMPSGGDLDYRYQWLIRTYGNWNSIAGATAQNYTPTAIVDTVTQFSRIVLSGPFNTCRDTSSVALVLDVVPYIQNIIVEAGQTICENSVPAALSGSPASGGRGGYIYEWLEKKQGMPGWIPAIGTNNTLSYIPGALTDNTLYSRRVTSDICSDTTNAIIITVYPFITNNSIPGGAIQYTCFNTDRLLTGSLPENGSGSYSYEWQQSINNTDWIPTTDTTMNFTTPVLTAPQYFRRVVYSSREIHECVDISSSVEVRINPLPSGDLIASNDTLCAGESFYAKFNIGGIHPPFSVTVGGITRDGYNLMPDSLLLTPVSTQVDPVSMQLYTMETIKDDSGCYADNSLFTEKINAIVYKVPSANAGADDEICSNTYSLKAERSIDGSTGNWSADGVAFADPAYPGTTATVDQYGANLFTWTEYNWQCKGEDEVKIIFNEQPDAADAGPDQILDFLYTTQLEAAIPRVGSGKWTVVSGAGDFDNDTLPNTMIEELDVASTLKWTVHNGNCPEVSDQVDILIDPLVIPKGFSPNGDTKNDNFDLGAVNAEKIRLKIYNSTGVLVFESDDYTSGSQWDGKNTNGVELPEGTYYYIADIKVAGREKEFQFRSFVEILR
jgi:gliding motility-associated-like protein